MQVHVSAEINSLLDAAVQLSVRRNHYFVGVEHLFDALVDATSLLPKSFREQYVSHLIQVSRELVRNAWRGEPASANGEVFYTPRCATLTGEAVRLAERYGQGPARAGHLLLAILADAHSAPSRLMDHFRMPRGEMIKALRSELTYVPAAVKGVRAAASPKVQDGAVRAGASGDRAASEQEDKTPVGILENLTRDLTEAARSGHLGPAVGRENEMFQILQILARKNKNNVMLVGEAGVGKTQIVEGLALAGISGGLGAVLSGWRILELNIGALMAGTQYRGSFEEKVMGLLDELKGEPQTILFIDEAHLIMGAGSTNGDSVDVANLLKPALARGEIRCIGATTLQEYRRFVEKDPAIERRFQMVRVEPLSEAATAAVLERLQSSLEEHHGVRISSKAIQAAVQLTQRYMPNRHLPDKAIDVLDQACARHRLKTIALQSKEGKARVSGTLPDDRVTPHDIRKVVSQLTAIPVEEITADERILLGNLEQILNERIIGQDQAVAKTVAAVKKSRAGLGDPNRPQAVLFFLGPSGVGKTELAKTLADVMFGSPNHLATFDMSEFTEEHSVSRLIGAPPGYVGSEEEGLLAGAVRRAPFSVMVFDEIEKAHSRVFDILLPVLDEGRLKDSRGRDVSFRNCIIIMTSNIGAEWLRRTEGDDDRRRLTEDLRQHFRPEFINRIDEVIPFYPLLFEDIRTILHHALGALEQRLKQKGIGLHVYQQAYEFLAREGCNEEFGARELRRTVDRFVVAPISDLLIKGEFGSGDTVDVLMTGNKLTIRKGEAVRA